MPFVKPAPLHFPCILLCFAIVLLYSAHSAAFLLLMMPLIADSAAFLLLMMPLIADSAAFLLLLMPLIADSAAFLLLMMPLIAGSAAIYAGYGADARTVSPRFVFSCRAPLAGII